MNFFKIKLNRRIFSVVLLVVLVFGGVYYAKSVLAWNPVEAFRRGISGEVAGIANNGDTRTAQEIAGNIENAGSLGMNEHNKVSGDDSVGPSVWLLKMSANFLMWTVSPDLYNKVFFSPIAKEGITQAWEAVRGFINMFYLLILVFLAITTILRINKFNDKKLFFNVIVSAILVNFSMAITLVVIDFSNLIMTYFASAIHDVNAVGTFFANSHYTKALVEGGQTIGENSFWLKEGSEMIGFIINIIMAVMILFVGISLLIRLVAYWVLIILSPLAFFSIAVPGSNGFTEWKDKLIHYSFYGPIMLFFIWLSMALTTYLESAFTHANNLTLRGDFMTFLTSYITALYILYYGHDKSKEMAKKAGDTVGMLMDKGGQYAVKAGKGAGILATGGLPLMANSRAKAEYTGMKTAMKDGRYGFLGKIATKEGRQNMQDEKDFNAKIRHADANHKDKLRMEEIYNTQKKLKDNGANLDDKDYVLKLLNSGNIKEQRMAADIASKKGWLSGSNYEKAMEIAKDSDLLKSSINAGAGGKNKIAVMDYQLKKYAQGDKNSEKYVNGKIKTLMMERAVATNNTALIEELDNRDITKDEADAFVSQMKISNKKAVQYAMFSEAGSMDNVTKLLNENMSTANKKEISRNFAEYLNDNNFAGERLSGGSNLHRLASMLNPVAYSELRNAGVVAKHSSNATTNANANTSTASPSVIVTPTEDEVRRFGGG